MITSNIKRLYAAFILGVALLLGAVAAPAAHAQIVQHQGGTNLVFSIDNATDGVLDAVAPIVAGGFIIIIFVIGVRYIYRQVRRV